MMWMTSLLVTVVTGIWSAGWFLRRYRAVQRQEAEQARSLERVRIAREMHDVLGHDLTLIALGAGALKLAPGLDDSHREAAADLRSKAGTAVRHLGEAVGVLRGEKGALEATDQASATDSAGLSVRWALVAALVAPLAVGMVAAVLAAGLEYLSVSRTVLEPATYSQLQSGQPRAQLADALPDRQLSRRGGEPGCEYYAITAQPMADRSGDAYRLCFTDGVLTSFEPVVEGG